ncbi:CATRA conflict system CASPASE/TPR repeat-associated protein [Actinomycetes bacterium KLBMP 9797]
MTPRRPALAVHTFFAAGSAPAPLRALWDGVAGLGMDTPIAGRPVDLPEVPGPGPDGLEVLAARQRVVPGAVYEALAYRSHDTVGVSVLLAPNDDRVDWRALREQWAAHAPRADAALGTVTVYLGLAPRRPWRLGHAQRAARLVRHVPDQPPSTVDRTADWCRTADGLLVSELSPDAGHAHRRLVVLADAADESTLDEWTWLSDGRELPPLTRYVLHAAKLRHQERVLVAARPGLRAAVERTERACDTLAELLRTPEPSAPQLRAAARDLALVQAEQGGLVMASTDASDMAETVRAARHNMAAALGRSPRCRPGGPFDRDQATATWLTEQLAIERTYVDSAARKADQVGRLAAAALDDRHRRRQEALTLFQASVLGSLLMALAAVQSLQYQIPVPGPLMAPLVCALAMVALVLPAGVLHWPRRGTPAPPAWRFVAGGLVAGASLGWLAATAGWWVARDAAAPPAWSCLVAALAALVAATTTLTTIKTLP